MQMNNQSFRAIGGRVGVGVPIWHFPGQQGHRVRLELEIEAREEHMFTRVLIR